MASMLLTLLVCYFTLVESNISNSIDLEEDELLALFDVMDSLLEDSKWAQYHPHPCTSTPWPGIECQIKQDEQSPPRFHVTEIHIGPDIISPPCKSSAFLSLSLPKLPFLKTISIFSCFTDSPVSIHPSLFETLSFLENVVFQSNPNLTGEIPSSLAKAGSLRTLCLKQNSLFGIIPKEIGGLHKLLQLDLSFNSINGSIPKELGGLQSLSILDLSWNQLEGKLPNSFGQLQLLEKMDLSFNELKGIIPAELGNLESLVLLDLSHNLLSSPIPSALSNLGNLEYFMADHNPFKTELPLFLGALKKLKTLSLSSCEFKGPIIPSSFSNLKSLISISLDNNSLSGELPRSLGSLPNLRELNLSRNNFSGELTLPEEFISKLGERLDVKGNNRLCATLRNVSIWLELPVCYNVTSRASESNPKDGKDEVKPHGLLSFNGGSNPCNQRLQKLFVIANLILLACLVVTS